MARRPISSLDVEVTIGPLHISAPAQLADNESLLVDTLYLPEFDRREGETDKQYIARVYGSDVNARR
jgi:hypothetical protein